MSTETNIPTGDVFHAGQRAGLETLVHLAETQARTQTSPAGGQTIAPPAKGSISTATILLAPSGRSRRTRAHVSPQRGAWARLVTGPRPLLCILTVQAALSLRLVWSNTAFADEALYLWGGRLELAHWLHGAPVPGFLPTFFSGAPVIYPPLGALANDIGGLTAARILSLCFMLTATTLLYDVTCRLYGRRAAIFAVALFAGVGSVQFMGAFATYDALALCLLGLATWLGVRSADQQPVKQIGSLISVAVVLALADATKYAATLFDPVVIAVVILALWRAAGRKAAIHAGVIVCSVLWCAILLALRAGGSAYWQGIRATTLTRPHGLDPAPGVLFVSGKWIGAVALLAVIGACAAMFTKPRSFRALAWTLAVATFLAPAEQARIRVLTSLFKHVGYGAWFGCAIAGYGLAALIRAVPAVKSRSARNVGITAVLLASTSGILYAGSHFAVWPNSTGYLAALQPWLARTKGEMLIDDASIPEYYLPQVGEDWRNITNSSYFAYTDPGTGIRLVQPPAAYADAIRHRYFSLIALTYGNAPTVYDPGIVQDIQRYGRYRLVVDLPYRTPSDNGEFLVWVREHIRVRQR